MSTALQMFTDNFWKGMQLGTQWQDKAEDRQIKRATLKYQLAKLEQDAAWKRAHLEETARRNTAYIAQSGAYADYLRRKGAGGGKGGPAGPDANVNAFLLDPRVNEPGLATPPPAAAAPSGGSASDETMVTPPAPPPADDGGGGGDDSYRRGGLVPRTRNSGISVARGMPQSASAGNTSGEGDSDSGYAASGGLQSALKPGVRFAGGGAVGAGLESRLKYTVRRAEKGARLTPPTTGLSRPIRAPAVDIVPGFAQGGPVALNTAASRVPAPNRQVSIRPSAGTSGPGSGFGDVAAPPVTYIPRYANGGSVNDPTEQMWNSFYQPSQAQPSRGGAGGAMLSAFAAAATRGMRQTRGTPQYADGGSVDDSELYYGPDPYADTYANRERQELTRLRAQRDPGETGGTPDVSGEDDQQREARAARERNPSKRNWVPPRRDVRTPFVGEEARADETPSSPAYEPGDSGSPPQAEQTMPPVTVSASRDGGGGGGRGAAPARRLQLGDQRRTAAYDPEADRMDPRNTGIVEPGGAVNERVWRATPEAHPEAYPDDNRGMFGERLDRPGPTPVPAEAGAGAIATTSPMTPTAPPPPDNYAARGASRYATNTYQGTDEHALFAGHGAPPPTEMADVFKVVDPDNKMPMHERMMVAQKAVHDYWMAKDDPKRADQASFEIGQFGNTMARQHGAKAIKALQSGDQNAALNELMAGYGWLPDGGTPQIQGNTIVVRGPDGGVQTTIPLQPNTIQNLALGMATGQLGWDVMHASAGRQVASRPAAQPQAAPAGPPPIPAAPQGGAQPPIAGGQGAGEPPVQVAQAPVSQTTPPAPSPVPTQMGPEGGAISTAPPAAPSPTLTPPATPTARAAAPAPVPSQTPPQGQGQRVPDPQAEAEQQHWAKNPYAPTREPNSAEERRDVEIERARREYIQAEQSIAQAANAHGLTGKGKLPAVVTQAIAAKKKIYDDRVKMIEGDYRANQAERQRDNVPRNMSLNDYQAIDSTFVQRSDALKRASTAQPDSRPAQFYGDSVLRYATGDDQSTIKEIATNIWQHNKGLSPQQAMDLALTSTSIMRPTDKEKEPVGQNRQKGAGATRFRPSNRGDKGLTYLQFGDGTDIRVDTNTYQRIKQQHAENWRQWAESQTKEAQDAAQRKKMGLNWNTLGAAARAGAALVPGLPLVEQGARGVIGSMTNGR